MPMLKRDDGTGLASPPVAPMPEKGAQEAGMDIAVAQAAGGGAPGGGPGGAPGGMGGPGGVAGPPPIGMPKPLGISMPSPPPQSRAKLANSPTSAEARPKFTPSPRPGSGPFGNEDEAVRQITSILGRRA